MRISPLSWLLDAGHDLDQGRLAGAVLAQQRVDLAASQLEGDVVERQRGSELLRDVLHLEHRAFIARRRDCFVKRPLDSGLNHPVRFPQAGPRRPCRGSI